MSAVAYLHELFVSIQGEGPHMGQRHLFVRFSGCNVRCRYCDTPDALERGSTCRVDLPGGPSQVRDAAWTVDELAAAVEAACAADPAIRMIAVTGGEPMVQHRFLAAWLSGRRPPRPVLLETHALSVDGLGAVLDGVAAVSADVKLPSNSGLGPRWQDHRDFLRACGGHDVYVKVPVDAGTTEDDVERAARLVAAEAPGATLFLQPLSEPDSNRWTIDRDELERLAAVATGWVPDTRIGLQLHKVLGVR